VTVPSLDDWEKDWDGKTADHRPRMAVPKVVLPDLRVPNLSVAQSN
jgi:hypothetical protein